jgi:hypothetical protein
MRSTSAVVLTPGTKARVLPSRKRALHVLAVPVSQTLPLHVATIRNNVKKSIGFG